MSDDEFDVDQFYADEMRMNEIMNSESIEEAERFINEELPAIKHRLEAGKRPATVEEIAGAVAWIPKGDA